MSSMLWDVWRLSGISQKKKEQNFCKNNLLKMMKYFKNMRPRRGLIPGKPVKTPISTNYDTPIFNYGPIFCRF
jgi:hypothetical protein